MEKDGLLWREWIFLVVITVTIGYLIFDTPPYVVQLAKKQQMEQKQEICVRISGEVLYPGEYRMTPGISIKKILHMAGGTPTYVMRQIYAKKVILHSCELFVGQQNSMCAQSQANSDDF